MKKTLKEFIIQFVGIKLGEHYFEYKIDKKFFEYFEYKEFNDANVNIDVVLNYLKGLEIYCCGRFAEFRYINSDKVVERAQALAKKLNEKVVKIS